MKKFFLMLMALMLAMTTLTVFAEDEAVIPSPDADAIDGAQIEGFVMDVLDESILLKTRDGLYVEALLTEETAAAQSAAQPSKIAPSLPMDRAVTSITTPKNSV